MEQLLHYTWKHKIFPLHELRTTDGHLIEVIHPGLQNTHAGPDFQEAKIKIDGTEWVGNVELHLKTSDWFRHHHDTNPAYKRIILHVASEVDMPLSYPNGQPIPQLQLPIPAYVRENYSALKQADANPRCRDVVEQLPTLLIHNWMTSLTLERFEEKATQIMQRREEMEKDWEGTLFVTIARNFGFGVNGDAFEKWSRSIPMSAVGKHRDNLFQIEAFFFGQAGLLEGECEDDYFQQLKKEYMYLRHKFSLTPIDVNAWKFLRLRPQNFPHIRIAQLAMLYYEQHLNLSRLLNAESMEEIHAMLVTHVSDYWLTHYTFGGKPTRIIEKTLSPASTSLIVINSVAPMLFTYGKYKSDPHMCQRAFSLWQDLKPENNFVVRDWAAANVTCENAADSQALLQLYRNYCQKGDCLRCKFGYEYIKRTPGFLREGEPTKKQP
ncbi:MAG: DUF2851 family protein [Bacteroidales bacterium]|nr:DUF2851 family protein [Bacteroidales bacterium]